MFSQQEKEPTILHVIDLSENNEALLSPKKQEAQLCETPRRLIRTLCRYSSLEKFGDGFDKW